MSEQCQGIGKAKREKLDSKDQNCQKTQRRRHDYSFAYYTITDFSFTNEVSQSRTKSLRYE